METPDEAAKRRRAALGSAVFLVVGPGTFAGVVPYLLTRWQARTPLPGGVPAQAAGAALVCGGGAVIVASFAQFVREGLGTPAPAAPPSELVVGGLYRHVRNPMYVALLSAVLGQALLLGRGRLVVYAAGAAALVHSILLLHEESVLRERFGAAYETYCGNVPRWLPRLRPWQQ